MPTHGYAPTREAAMCGFREELAQGMMPMNYATFESHPAMYDDREAWVLFDPADGWRKLQHAEVLQKARPLAQADFERRVRITEAGRRALAKL